MGKELDPSERYLYMYLLTNPQTNISGIYQITLDRIAFDTGYDERTLTPMFERFRKAGKAAFIQDEWIILPSWPKHQKWDIKPTIKKGIESVLASTPKDILSYAKDIGYTYPIDSLLVGYTYQPSYSDLDSDTDSDTDTDFDLISQNDETAVQCYSAPAKAVATSKKKSDLSEQELALYHEIKRWFESKPESMSLMYKDKQASGRTGKAIKTIVERCFTHSKQNGGEPIANSKPMVAMFHKAIYEKRPGAIKLRVTSRLVGLATEWVWDTIYMQCKDYGDTGSEDAIALKIQGILETKRRVFEKTEVLKYEGRCFICSWNFLHGCRLITERGHTTKKTLMYGLTSSETGTRFFLAVCSLLSEGNTQKRSRLARCSDCYKVPC